ncbi:MAG: OmpA family protein [Flavobacteriales bacterium]
MSIQSILLSFICISSFSVIDAQTFSLESSYFEVGDVYISDPKIYFEFSKWTIKSESYSALDSIAVFLKENERLVIEIGVHIDSRGNEELRSRNLSLSRAVSILEYLKENGVDETRLEAKGYGKSEPLISDQQIDKMETYLKKEDAHALNRRTEFKITVIRK